MKKVLCFIIFVLLFPPLFADAKNIVYSNTFNYKTLSQLEISLTYEQLQISRIYGDEIVVEIGSNYIKKIPDVVLEEDLLKITSKQDQKPRRGDKCNVYVYLPQDFTAQSIIINNVSGNITADILQAQNAVLVSNGSGRTNISKCQTEYFSVLSVSGNSTLQKISAEYFELSATSGNIFAELETIPLATSMISNISGKSQLYYPKQSNFDIIAFSINGTNNHTTIGAGGPQVTLTSVSGKIEFVGY